MDPVVETRHGEVCGTTAGRVNTFEGTPYVAPPFGAERLRRPQTVEPRGGATGSSSPCVRHPRFRDGPARGPGSPQQRADAMHAARACFAAGGDAGRPEHELDRGPIVRFGTTWEVVDDPDPRNVRCGKERWLVRPRGLRVSGVAVQQEPADGGCSSKSS